jgi:hypothetical protein
MRYTMGSQFEDARTSPRAEEPHDSAWLGPDDDSARPLEEQLPPAILATPSEVSHGPDDDIRWWRPGWADACRHVGYRWIFIVASIVPVVVLLALSLARPWMAGSLWFVEIRLLLVFVAVAASVAGYVVRRAVRARKEPFCIYCGYDLTALPDNYRCPECGRPYTWRLIAEYRKDPQWFIDRYNAHRNLPPADPPFQAGSVRRRTRDGT